MLENWDWGFDITSGDPRRYLHDFLLLVARAWVSECTPRRRGWRGTHLLLHEVVDFFVVRADLERRSDFGADWMCVKFADFGFCRERGVCLVKAEASKSLQGYVYHRRVSGKMVRTPSCAPSFKNIYIEYLYETNLFGHVHVTTKVEANNPGLLHTDICHILSMRQGQTYISMS